MVLPRAAAFQKIPGQHRIATMLILYGTSACHLCEQAADLLDALGAGYRSEDISASDELFERYGLTIPVLRREDGAELNWPFDRAALCEFIGPG